MRYRNKLGTTKVILQFLAFGFLLNTSSCKPDIQQSKINYFDLKAYFTNQSEKLQKQDLSVLKTVSRNQEAETKKVKITNWADELSVFSEADINKPSWRNSYKTTASGNITIYKALEPNLKTREIILKKENGRLVYLMIFNVVNNSLFQTREKLSFYQDSLYRIERKQHVRFLGENNYLIEGKIK